MVIISVVTSCKKEAHPLGANSNFVGNEPTYLNDTSWVYDTTQHVYNAAKYVDLLDADAVSQYEVKVGLRTGLYVNWLPYSIDSVTYTATYKEHKVYLKATPMKDSVSYFSLAKDFEVFVWK